MTTRWLFLAAAVSLAPAASAQVPAAPAGATPSAAAVKGQAARAHAGYVAPRTPWGDPDLQGTFTNKYEQSTPFERPQGFEGRRIEDIQSKELAELIARRQQQAIDRAPFLSGDPTGKIAGPMEFRDIYEISKASRPWFIVDPPDGKIPPLTDDAQRRIAARPRGGTSFSNGVYDSWEDLGLYDRCITRGFPGSMMPAIYGDSYQIIQGQGVVAIRIEMIHDTRVIPLDDRPHLDGGLGSDFGDPRGHWDGDTLVVETANFRERSAYRNANPRTLRLVERFTRVAPGTIEWAVTVIDPATWARPWTFSIPLTLNDREPVYEYACHEGNYAIMNILSGSRAADPGLRADQ